MVLPPEKAEGCESYLQYLHAEDGEREAAREGSKFSGKKRISLNVNTRRLAVLKPGSLLYLITLKSHGSVHVLTEFLSTTFTELRFMCLRSD